MIGNDIVDISAASNDCCWRRDGYLNKIFTKDEQDYILNSNDQEKTVWLLWSMKESAYKIFVRKFKKRFFAPLKFKCFLNDHYRGEVLTEGERYITNSEITSNYISTIAIEEKETINSFIKENIQLSGSDYLTQHREVKKAALLRISGLVNTPLHLLKINKDEYGIPHIYCNDLQIEFSVSLSHHGKYAAYAISY